MNELRLILLLAGIVIIIGVFIFGRNRIQRHSQQLSRFAADNPQQSRPKGLLQSQRQTKGSRKRQMTGSHQLNYGMLEEFSDDIDWDNLDELDLEWLEESLDNIDYDQLMYQLNEGYAEAPMSGGIYGYGSASGREKLFISIKKPDTETMRQAISTAQNVETMMLVTHILAKKGKHFTGRQLLKALKHIGMEYGEGHLFHYYADPEKTSEVQHKQRMFSLANVIEPGTFDRDSLETLKTPGVTLLLPLPGPIDNTIAFETYYQTAKSLAGKLDGVLYDASRNRLTKQCLEQMKQEVADFNLKIQVAHHTSVH